MNAMWAYAVDSGYRGQDDLSGFTVEALDGTVGQVDRQADRPGSKHLVVDTGVWIFGKSVLIPAGVVTSIDTGKRTVTVARTKDEIKAAPRFTVDSETADPAYLAQVGAYYAALEREPVT